MPKPTVAAMLAVDETRFVLSNELSLVESVITDWHAGRVAAADVAAALAVALGHARNARDADAVLAARLADDRAAAAAAYHAILSALPE